MSGSINSTLEKDSYNDFMSSFIVDSTSDCFKTCISTFDKPEIEEKEKNCLLSCFTKFNYSYLTMNEIIDQSLDKN